MDLEKQTVRTLAGDGTKAEGNYIGGQRGSAQRLNSPWDLAFDQQVQLTADLSLRPHSFELPTECAEGYFRIAFPVSLQKAQALL